MITIRKSVNADSRTAKKNATIQDLETDTKSHISDVAQGLRFIADLIEAKGKLHDHTKLENLSEFHAALTNGHVKESEWYKKHITEERHHLLSYVHDDVNLTDVVEHIVDCVMAGLARSGSVYDIELPNDVLQLAVKNTVELLKANVQVVESDDLMDQPVE